MGDPHPGRRLRVAEKYMLLSYVGSHYCLALAAVGFNLRRSQRDMDCRPKIKLRRVKRPVDVSVVIVSSVDTM